jgi:hypothetical protein
LRQLRRNSGKTRKAELKIPKELRPVVEEIVGITDSVCLSVLDEEAAGRDGGSREIPGDGNAARCFRRR